ALGKGWRLMVVVFSAPPKALLDAANARDSAAMAKVMDSAEGQEYRSRARQFEAEVSSDNTVTAEGVPSGSYVLTAVAMNEGSGQTASPLTWQVTLSVPADPPIGS